MGYRYIVLGAGMQGIAAVYDLKRHCEAEKVILVEPNPERRIYASRRLEGLIGGSMPCWILPELADTHLKHANVILSCAPHIANLEITKRAIKARVPYCDLGGNGDVVEAQATLCDTLNARSPVIPDCGVSPGLSNIFAAHLALQGYDTIRVRCGGNPLTRPDPSLNPWLYKLVFSPEGLASEYAGKSTMIQNGALVTVPALSSIEHFNKEFESAPTANNSPRTAKYLLQCGVRNYLYGTLRYHGHFDNVLAGRVGIDEVQFAKRARAMPELQFNRAKDADRLTLSIEGTKKTIKLGVSAERRMTYLYEVSYCEKLQFTAMELMTSWGITTVAHYMASHKGLQPGFSMPEQFIKDAEWFFAQINTRLKHTLSL